MTWHPIQRPSHNLNSPRSIEQSLKRPGIQRFERSVSAPRGATEQNDAAVKVKLGTVTRERQLFTAYSHRQTPSPTR